MKNNFQWTNETSNFQNIPGRNLQKDKCLFYSKIPKNEFGWFTENNSALQAVFLLMYELGLLVKERLAWEFLHLL